MEDKKELNEEVEIENEKDVVEEEVEEAVKDIEVEMVYFE